MVVCGVNLEFDVLDAEQVKKWHSTRQKLARQHRRMLASRQKGPQSLMDWTELLRRACHVVFAFFDEMFGEGTSNQLFGESCNFDDCMQAYRQFEEAAALRLREFCQRQQQYTPAGPKGKQP